MSISQYLAPLQSANDSTKIGWLREAKDEAKRALEQCIGYADLQSDLELISRQTPSIDPRNPTSYDRLNVGTTKARINDVVSTLSNLRPMWQAESGISQLQQSIKVLDKCSWGWWAKTRADLKIRAALQWSAVCRTGYLWVNHDPHYHGMNQGDVDLVPLDPKKVYHLWMPEDFNYQKAHANIICENVPLPQARADYPFYANQLKATSTEEPGMLRRAYNLIVKGADTLFTGEDAPKTDPTSAVPMVTIYHMYVRDMTLNHSGRTVKMGDPLGKNFYEVPYIGQQVPSGFVNPSTANDILRRANEDDCYLYPNRRLIKFTDTCILYDGPSNEYHGLAPIVKFTLDPWPWDFLGGSMVQDVRSIDETINKRLRGIDKSAEMRRNPPKMVDEEQFAQSEQGEVAKIVDTSIGEPGATIQASFKTGDPIRAVLPYQNYDVQAWEFEYLQFLNDKADFCTGRAQMEALAAARQMPAGDTQEKWLQVTGSRTTAKSRTIEDSMTQLGYMVDCNIIQHYSAVRRFSLYGWGGVVKSDFDLDPGTLVPDIVEGLYDHRADNYGSRYQRARAVCKALSVSIEPMSIHELTSMTRQLLYTRLMEGQHFPMDFWTVAKTLNISNMGDPPPTENDTMPERYLAQMEITAKASATLQAQAQQIMMSANPQALIEQAIQQDPQGVLQMVIAAMQAQNNGGGDNSAGGGSNGATGRPEGRPSSYQQPPKLFNRSDGNGGQRTVLATSKTD